MSPHIVCIGGEDHALRIPFILRLTKERGFRVTAVSPTDGSAFSDVQIPHRSYMFDRFSSGATDWRIIRSLRNLMVELEPDLIHTFDTKPNLLVPLAVRGRASVVRTINGLGWVFSSSEPRALALRPVYCAAQMLASRSTARLCRARQKAASRAAWSFSSSSGQTGQGPGATGTAGG